MTNIRRYDPGVKPVFITAVCYHRTPYLQSDCEKELLLSVMREIKNTSAFTMIAYVILNDHFHLIITPGKKTISKIMQSIKLRFVHRFKKANGKTDNITVWQKRFWDHIIRNKKDLHLHMDYIHYNPVKHGYVLNPVDYCWSSFNTHVNMGHYSKDWGSMEVPLNNNSLNLE